MFTDSDGNVVIGSDGKPVTYERGEDGVVKWSENATTDVIEVGNAMLSTEFGEKAFNKWQNADTKITITIDREIAPEDGNYAETKPTLADDGYGKVNKDGQYEEAEIIFYEKNIEKNRKRVQVKDLKEHQGKKLWVLLEHMRFIIMRKNK